MRTLRKFRLSWTSELPAFEVGTYKVVPLTSSSELRREASAMQNCLGTYDLVCAAGSHRLFSIRDLDDRCVANMSLVLGPHGWHLDDIRGPRNTEVVAIEETFYDGERTETVLENTELYYVAHEVVRRYQKQCRDQQSTQEIH